MTRRTLDSGYTMRRRLTSAMWAGLIVAIGANGYFALIGTVGSEGRLWEIAATLLLPGIFAAMVLGLGTGVHGIPNQEDLAPYLIAFVMWWVIIDQARAWWQRRRRTDQGANAYRSNDSRRPDSDSRIT